ncbi:alpha/beta fold hydrolase [Bradyrhizobium sp.]|jgi:pimeloyl-ACP methyl ester carboxylesterase|uniref:alpha/beta fold hydrolase n=1 Tax=Bradyrhizobium sp. TaxID=376 RepID=UPI00039E190B
MRVLVNGVRLYFDVEGAALVPDGPAMRQKPTVLLLHGGPGFDHTSYKPAYSALTDIAQLVYLDHRGNGRSEDGPQELWTLLPNGATTSKRSATSSASSIRSCSASRSAASSRCPMRPGIRSTRPS